MHKGVGWVREIRIDNHGQLAAWIRCDSGLLPEPGQYLLGRDPQDSEAALAAKLFPGQITDQGFLALDFPRHVEPGTELELRGPLGRGFRLPNSVQRLALVAFAGGPDYLLPLAENALDRHTAVALFCDPPYPSLPSSIEISPLASLTEIWGWADFLVIELHLEALPNLRDLLGARTTFSNLSGQVLLRTSMPCGGIAECGVCAVAQGRGWKYACRDGPVFDLHTLEF